MLRVDKITIVPVKKDGELVYRTGVKRARQIIFQVYDSSKALNDERGLYGELVVRLKSMIWVDWDREADYETKKVVPVRD